MIGLSNGKPGLIEVLLFNLRLKIDEELELKNKNTRNSFKLSNQSQTPNSYLVNNSKKISSNYSKKNISNLNYEEIKQEYFQQEEEIEVLQAKVRRLEHLIQLKDTRIKDLLTNVPHN